MFLLRRSLRLPASTLGHAPLPSVLYSRRSFSVNLRVRQELPASPGAAETPEQTAQEEEEEADEEDFGFEATTTGVRVTHEGANIGFQAWKSSKVDHPCGDERCSGAVFPPGERFRTDTEGPRWLGGEVPFPANPTFRPPTPLANVTQSLIYAYYINRLATPLNHKGSSAEIDAFKSKLVVWSPRSLNEVQSQANSKRPENASAKKNVTSLSEMFKADEVLKDMEEADQEDDQDFKEAVEWAQDEMNFVSMEENPLTEINDEQLQLIESTNNEDSLLHPVFEGSTMWKVMNRGIDYFRAANMVRKEAKATLMFLEERRELINFLRMKEAKVPVEELEWTIINRWLNQGATSKSTSNLAFLDSEKVKRVQARAAYFEGRGLSKQESWERAVLVDDAFVRSQHWGDTTFLGPEVASVRADIKTSYDHPTRPTPSLEIDNRGLRTIEKEEETYPSLLKQFLDMDTKANPIPPEIILEGGHSSNRSLALIEFEAADLKGVLAVEDAYWSKESVPLQELLEYVKEPVIEPSRVSIESEEQKGVKEDETVTLGEERQKSTSELSPWEQAFQNKKVYTSKLAIPLLPDFSDLLISGATPKTNKEETPGGNWDLDNQNLKYRTKTMAVRETAAKFGISMDRARAVIKLMEVQREWVSKGIPLQENMNKSMEALLGVQAVPKHHIEYEMYEKDRLSTLQSDYIFAEPALASKFELEQQASEEFSLYSGPATQTTVLSDGSRETIVSEKPKLANFSFATPVSATPSHPDPTDVQVTESNVDDLLAVDPDVALDAKYQHKRRIESLVADGMNQPDKLTFNIPTDLRRDRDHRSVWRFIDVSGTAKGQEFEKSYQLSDRGNRRARRKRRAGILEPKPLPESKVSLRFQETLQARERLETLILSDPSLGNFEARQLATSIYVPKTVSPAEVGHAKRRREHLETERLVKSLRDVEKRFKQAVASSQKRSKERGWGDRLGYELSKDMAREQKAAKRIAP